MPKKPIITVAGREYEDKGRDIPVITQGPTRAEQLAREQDEKERQRADLLYNTQHFWNFGPPANNPEQAMSQYNYNSSLGSATAKAGPLGGGMISSPIRTTISLGLGSMGANYGGKIGEALGGGEDTNEGDVGRIIGETTGGIAGGTFGWKWSTATAKRGLETAMRTTSSENPLPIIGHNLKRMWNGNMGGRGRLGNIALRIFTGIKNGEHKGYWGSFGEWYPEGKSTFLHPGKGSGEYYGGIGETDYGMNEFTPGHPYNATKSDFIDAMLYNKEVDPSFGLHKRAEGEQFGVHYRDIQKMYPDKASKIQVYETNHYPVRGKIKGNKDVEGVDHSIPIDLTTINQSTGKEVFLDGTDPIFVNTAGHYRQTGRAKINGQYEPVVKH